MWTPPPRVQNVPASDFPPAKVPRPGLGQTPAADRLHPQANRADRQPYPEAPGRRLHREGGEGGRGGDPDAGLGVVPRAARAVGPGPGGGGRPRPARMAHQNTEQVHRQAGGRQLNPSGRGPIFGRWPNARFQSPTSSLCVIRLHRRKLSGSGRGRVPMTRSWPCSRLNTGWNWVGRGGAKPN